MSEIKHRDPDHDLVKSEGVPGGAQRAEYEVDHTDDHGHVVSMVTYYKVFAALMVLLLITVLAADFDAATQIGPSFAWMNIIIALAVAVTKAVLIVLFFMHVKYSSRLVWIFSGAAYFFLIIMFAMTYADYFTRGWLPVPGK